MGNGFSWHRARVAIAHRVVDGGENFHLGCRELIQNAAIAANRGQFTKALQAAIEERRASTGVGPRPRGASYAIRDGLCRV